MTEFKKFVERRETVEACPVNSLANVAELLDFPHVSFQMTGYEGDFKVHAVFTTIYAGEVVLDLARGDYIVHGGYDTDGFPLPVYVLPAAEFRKKWVLDE